MCCYKGIQNAWVFLPSFREEQPASLLSVNQGKKNLMQRRARAEERCHKCKKGILALPRAQS